MTTQRQYKKKKNVTKSYDKNYFTFIKIILCVSTKLLNTSDIRKLRAAKGEHAAQVSYCSLAIYSLRSIWGNQ